MKANQAEKINVRGIDFFNVTLDEAVDIAKSFIESPVNKTPSVIYTPNSEIVQKCIDNKKNSDNKLFEIINSASMVIPDGAGVVLASKILGTPLKQKVAGIDLAYRLIQYLDDTGGKLFLLGAREEVVKTAKENLNKKHKNLNVFINNGFFNKEADSEENKTVVEKINQAEPDVVFVCLGMPWQEPWIYENKSKLNAKLLIGLGGTIDDIAGVVKRAPKILIKLNLEWFYRLIKNPSRLKRMMRLPRFVFGTMFLSKKEL